MVGIIRKSLQNKIWEVVQFGKDRDNGTRESIGNIIILEFKLAEKTDSEYRTGIAMAQEQILCKQMYEKDLGKDWVMKQTQEYEHYKMLEHGMLHQINKTQYFFEEGVESRKIIIFSDDCISSIQLIVRPEQIGLMVHMRSSDLINLLPLDVIALTNILETVIQNHKISIQDKRIVIHVVFGSLHIYKSDLEIAKKVGISLLGETYQEERRRYINK